MNLDPTNPVSPSVDSDKTFWLPQKPPIHLLPTDLDETNGFTHTPIPLRGEGLNPLMAREIG